jgi:hypothetical protein
LPIDDEVAGDGFGFFAIVSPSAYEGKHGAVPLIRRHVSVSALPPDRGEARSRAPVDCREMTDRSEHRRSRPDEGAADHLEAMALRAAVARDAAIRELAYLHARAAPVAGDVERAELRLRIATAAARAGWRWLAALVRDGGIRPSQQAVIEGLLRRCIPETHPSGRMEELPNSPYHRPDRQIPEAHSSPRPAHTQPPQGPGDRSGQSA